MTTKHVRGAAALGCVGLLVAGCGGGSSSGASSPSQAASADVNALLSGDLASACAYVPPSVQAHCRSGLRSVTGINATGNATIVKQVVQGEKALVALTGRVCLKAGNTGSTCISNADPSTGMPGGSVSFQSAFSAALTNFNSSNGSASGPFSPIPCIEIDGRWYVDSSGP